MKVNCILKQSAEYDNGFERVVTAQDVGPDETVGQLLDRLVGYDGRGERPRRFDPSAVVELRVAREPEPSIK